MKKVAIIGFGGHVEKNILPAFNRSKKLEVEFVYVRDVSKYQAKAKANNVKLSFIDEDISEDVDWVYISTPISTHYELTKHYLNKGKNVICEKPLVTSVTDAKELFALAKEKELKLHEVCMYQYHKQYAHLKNMINDNLQQIKTVKASFTIPHLPKDDIRYKKDLSGGALLDVGFYPISIMINLFGNPKQIKSVVHSEKGYEVDLTGAAILQYDHFYCIAEWGIGLPYSNEVSVVTEQKVIKYARAFSKPETYSTTVEISEGFNTSHIEIGEDDQFLNMFLDLITVPTIITDSKVNNVYLIDVCNALGSIKYSNE